MGVVKGLTLTLMGQPEAKSFAALMLAAKAAPEKDANWGAVARTGPLNQRGCAADGVVFFLDSSSRNGVELSLEAEVARADCNGRVHGRNSARPLLVSPLTLTLVVVPTKWMRAQQGT